MDYLDRLSHFAAALQFRDLPPATREQAAWVLADTLAAIVAGSAEPELRAFAATRTDAGAASLVGLGRGADAAFAALVNGTAGTFLEMDEGNRFSRGHPAVHVVPALMAWAQVCGKGIDADDFLSALVAGYEVGSRLGAACMLRPAMHPHGTWGTIGAAAACARAAGLDASGMRETINIAASLSTATSKRTMLEGGLVRNVYAGMANHNGLLALQLAHSGFSGEADGPGSLFGGIVAEGLDRDAVVRDLGTDWHIDHNYFKLHSCCRFNHGTLDALDHIAADGGLPAADDVRHVRVDSYRFAAELDDKAPRNTLAAKFSVPFAVATRIVNGSSALASFTWDAVRDERVRTLAQRVDVHEDPAMTLRLPQERPARVTITLADGRTLVGEAGVNRGDDALPYSRGELRAKFVDLVQRAWPRDVAESLLQQTLDLGTGKGALGPWLASWGRPPAH